jgi:hypothetical protein
MLVPSALIAASSPAKHRLEKYSSDGDSFMDTALNTYIGLLQRYKQIAGANNQS